MALNHGSNIENTARIYVNAYEYGEYQKHDYDLKTHVFPLTLGVIYLREWFIYVCEPTKIHM